MSNLSDLYPGDRIVEFMIVVSIVATVLSGVALVVSGWLQNNPAGRHCVLLAALACIGASPLLTLALAWAGITVLPIPLPFPTEAESAKLGPQNLRQIDRSDVTRNGGDVVTYQEHQHTGGSAEKAGAESAFLQVGRLPKGGSTAIDHAESARGLQAFRGGAAIVCIGWLVGTVALLLRLAWSRVRLETIRRTARPISIALSRQLLRDVQQILGARQMPPVATSNRIRAPLAAGVLRPIVILPSAATNSTTSDELRDVLVHEFAHIQRRDPLVAMLQAMTGAVFWPVPLVYLLNRELARSREEICDNYVLRFRDRPAYGRTLLRLAELAYGDRRLPAAIGIFHGPGSLEKRIQHLIDPGRSAMTHTRAWFAIFVLVTFAATSGVLCGAKFTSASGRDNGAGTRISGREALMLERTGETQSPRGAASRGRASNATGPGRNAANENVRNRRFAPIAGRQIERFASLDDSAEESPNDKAGRQESTTSNEQPPDAKKTHRVVFVPRHGIQHKTSWTALAPSKLAVEEPFEQLIARVALEGEFPVKRPGDEEPLFTVKLMAGSDKSLNVKLTRPGGVSYKRVLQRGKPLSWKLKGETYRLLYPNSEVAADKPAESNFATIFITHRPQATEGAAAPRDDDRPRGDGSAGGADSQPSQAPPAAESDDGGSELLRKIRQSRAPLLADLADNHGYGLRPDEMIRRIAPPFAPLRMTYYRIAHPTQARAISDGPTAMSFQWDGVRLHSLGMTFAGDEKGYSLSGVLDALLGIKRHEVEGPSDLLKTRLPGDWVVRGGIPEAVAIAHLEKALRNDIGLPVRLEFRIVERNVYVARGHYRFTPLPGQPSEDTIHYTDATAAADPVQIFGKELVAGSGGGGTGNFAEFLQWLGRWIGTPIADAVAEPPHRLLSWQLHERSPSNAGTRREDHDAELVLKNVTAQTSLRFAQESRPVKLLFVERTE